MAESRRAIAERPGSPPPAIDRKKLVRELLELRRHYERFEPRDKEICALLKQDAKDNGGNFKVTIEGLGFASVSAPKDKRRTATSYELDVGNFLALPQRQRDALTDKGTVKEVEVWTGAYYGAVSVELFPASVVKL
jgi:hypothetical protein